MKKIIFGIIAILSVFALVMTSCSSGGSDTPPVDPNNPSGSGNTVLSALQIGTAADTRPGTSNRADTIAGIPSLATVAVITSENTAEGGVEVTLTKGASFNGTIEISKTSGENVGAFAAYNPDKKPKFTFVDGDKLYVKMTAEDGTTVMYYGFLVEVGNDATLKDITFSYTYIVGGVGGTPTTVTVSLATDGSLGEGVIKDAADTTPPVFSADNQGNLLFSTKQPAGGFNVEAETFDPDVTVKISKDGSDWQDAVTITFAEDDPLYAKVTSSNGRKVHYYKVIINLMKAVDIPYGTPATVDAATPDALWDTGATEWLYIDRANPAEGTGWLDLADEDKSFGRAKLMWDENGIWMYAQVWEKAMSPVGSDTYDASSVELFINEGYGQDTSSFTGDKNTVTSATTVMGGQYRLSANGVRTTPQSNQQPGFEALLASAKKYESNDFPYTNPKAINELKTGYVVIFQAPWRFPNNYPLVDNKELAVELQINATKPETRTRAGVLNWNNIQSNSYGSLADYGAAVLKLNGNTLKPQKPTITTQPANVKVDVGATIPALGVVAISIDQGELGYQWYQAGSATADGTLLDGATSNTYTPTVSTATETDYFFYVIVSNIKGGVSNTRKSDVAKVTIFDPSSVINTKQFVKTDDPAYDATEGGLVYTITGQYQTFLTLNLPSDISGYSRIEIIFDAYAPQATDGGKVPHNQYGNTIFCETYSASGSSTGNGGYNASGLLGTPATGLFYNLSEAQKAGTYGTVQLKSKYGSGNAYTVNKIVIKSLLLVSADPIVLDLSKTITDGVRGTSAALTYTAPTLSIDFTGNQNAFIEVPASQIDRISDATTLRVTITGTSTGTANRYRVFLSHPSAGADWNGSNALDGSGADFSAISNATKAMTLSGNKSQTGRLSSFLITTGLAGGGNGFTSAETLSITKIEIDPVY